uniref:Iron-sulfur cluster assembly accessory protein n=1 Tax=Sciadococcus taiwanensis TaxID=3028030 RepID=A0A9Y1I245_9RHOD|nr:Iron-sulfur cluster assembly accessory protein [Sciadococcus taiwanensis]
MSSTRPIKITQSALDQLKHLQSQTKEQLLLRLGVRQGGCSGMSYMMDFEQKENITQKDTVIQYENFTIICDPKSLLYLYGLSLDYNAQLIGGGFKFVNPNAVQTCGCGQSFNA